MAKSTFKDKKDLIKNGQGHIHETMDRIYIVQNNLQDFVIDQPVAKTMPAIKKKLERAALLLAECYQDVGQLWK